MDDQPPVTPPIAMDPDAVSADPELPAFLAVPEGAPAYYGFPMVEGAEVDGFRFGMITDFIEQRDTYGDAYVIAPDNSRAGLIWQSECDPFFTQAGEPDDRTWGLWSVGLPLPMHTAADAKEYLRALLPDLRPRWQSWTTIRDA